jgi:hypothetical protein
MRIEGKRKVGSREKKIVSLMFGAAYSPYPFPPLPISEIAQKGELTKNHWAFLTAAGM